MRSGHISITRTLNTGGARLLKVGHHHLQALYRRGGHRAPRTQHLSPQRLQPLRLMRRQHEEAHLAGAAQLVLEADHDDAPGVHRPPASERRAELHVGGVRQVQAEVMAGHDRPEVKEPRRQQQLPAAPRVPPAAHTHTAPVATAAAAACALAVRRLSCGVHASQEVGAHLARRLKDDLLLDEHLVVRDAVPRVVERARAHAVAHRGYTLRRFACPTRRLSDWVAESLPRAQEVGINFVALGLWLTTGHRRISTAAAVAAAAAASAAGYSVRAVRVAVDAAWRRLSRWCARGGV
eukprot:CAMPEP_0197582404 /NCGR_PEP_ID=MMETSP1326-20131121/5625_1 /TAXON_ID=1155430 /ORGANISM="Genus nov. species nov., Strain RCC2288" /LENGTH=293 /DNA_ID=CAMNT_0043146479 /DNA_START=159 /DNA_END=1037 /DNA_ORIENTATION=+